MKNLFTVLTLLFTLNAFAEDACNMLFSEMPSGSYFKSDVVIPSDIRINRKYPKTVIKNAVKKYAGVQFTGETFDEALETVFQSIGKRTDIDDIAKADEMAKFGRELNDVFEGMIKKHPADGGINAPKLKAWTLRKEAIDEVKSIKFNLAKKISQFENFKKSEYIEVNPEDFLITQGSNKETLTHMRLEDYPKYVESWVHYSKDADSAGAKLFRDIDEGDLGVLEIGQIRDITSYNLWPMYLKKHDMRHIHYARSHPMAVAVMMQTSRSKNSRRYVMMGGLYEGVDRVQYTHETALNKFFGSQIAADEALGINRNLDLEEAMLTLAIAPNDDLVKIANATTPADIDEFISDLGDWRPKRVKSSSDFNGLAQDGRTLDQEVDDMVESFTTDVHKSNAFNRKLMDDNSIELTEQEELFMKSMNFQINPEDPEIVIDGIRYKNDGRGHYNGDGYGSWGGGDPNNPAPIGIGDQ